MTQSHSVPEVSPTVGEGAEFHFDELENVYRYAPIGLAVLDHELRWVRINEHLARLNGYPVEAHLGKRVDELLPEVAPILVPILRHVLATGEPQPNVEVTGVTLARPGVERVWCMHCLPLHDATGAVVGINVVCEEVTDKKWAERALRNAASRMRQMADIAPAMLWVTDAEHCCTFISQSWSDFTGQTEAGWNGVGWLDAVHPDDRDRSRRAFFTAVEQRVTYEIEYRLRHQVDGYRWVFAAGRPWWNERREFLGYIGSVIDISERKRAEDALHDRELQLRALNESLEQRIAQRTEQLELQTHQLQRLALDLVATEQRERKILAQTLHDGLQQLLVAAKFQIGICEEDNQQPSLTAPLHQAQEAICDAIETTRSLAVELSPTILHDAGLPAALKWLARQFEERHGLRVDLAVRESCPKAAEMTAEFLFSAARELLLNGVKHAHLDRVEIHLDAPSPDTLMLEVRDDGPGFDYERIRQSATEPTGFGLLSLRERAEAMGGHLLVETAPGQGARFVLTLPNAPR